MKAITIARPGAAPQVDSDIPVPVLGEGQVLVKTLYTAVNPVYVPSFPLFSSKTSSNQPRSPSNVRAKV
jgi:NADPH-dependent curcumin reductase CurA